MGMRFQVLKHVTNCVSVGRHNLRPESSFFRMQRKLTPQSMGLALENGVQDYQGPPQMQLHRNLKVITPINFPLILRVP